MSNEKEDKKPITADDVPEKVKKQIVQDSHKIKSEIVKIPHKTAPLKQQIEDSKLSNKLRKTLHMN